MGTYAQRDWDRERELQWCAEHGRFTPFGGETVPSSARTPIAQVIRELELLHATYLNSSYHRGTLEGWKKAVYQGSTGTSISSDGSDIDSRRNACESRRWSNPAGRSASNWTCTMSVSPPRSCLARWPCLLIQSDRTLRVALTDADPCRLGPEAGTVTLRGAMPIPADARGGRWRLALQLADPAPSLNRDGRYAIRLANEAIAFDEANGWNILAEDVEIREQ